jgi:hypothetical protein
MAKLNQLDPEQLRVLESLVQKKLQLMLNGPSESTKEQEIAKRT